MLHFMGIPKYTKISKNYFTTFKIYFNDYVVVYFSSYSY